MTPFAQILKQLRENRNIKKNELAAVLNVTPSVISQYESGRSMPGYDIMLKISAYFDVSVDYLLGKDSRSQKLDRIYYADTDFWHLLEQCDEISADYRDLLMDFIAVLCDKSAKKQHNEG